MGSSFALCALPYLPFRNKSGVAPRLRLEFEVRILTLSIAFWKNKTLNHIKQSCQKK